MTKQEEVLHQIDGIITFLKVFWEKLKYFVTGAINCCFHVVLLKYRTMYNYLYTKNQYPRSFIHLGLVSNFFALCCV